MRAPTVSPIGFVTTPKTVLSSVTATGGGSPLACARWPAVTSAGGPNDDDHRSVLATPLPRVSCGVGIPQTAALSNPPSYPRCTCSPGPYDPCDRRYSVTCASSSAAIASGDTSGRMHSAAVPPCSLASPKAIPDATMPSRWARSASSTFRTGFFELRRASSNLEIFGGLISGPAESLGSATVLTPYTAFGSSAGGLNIGVRPPTSGCCNVW
mmetsp:Transcript_35350/g.92455  ORF Transcript_35350/g.92455 Transcript_35350/m.92455 type:complete len:212 (+) Transcript_35350:692-1327(+)